MASIYSQYHPDYVVNFAAESHNDRAISAPGEFMRANALGAQTMLECSRRQPVTRHLHVSTIEVYGELPATAPYFDEASPLNAKTPYSAAKAAGDQIVRAYMHTYPEMDIAMTHCANNYGPFQLPEKLIPLMITNVLRGRKVPVYGDGLQMRDWLHVIDHCRAIHTILAAEIGHECLTRRRPIPRSPADLRHQCSTRGHEPRHRQTRPRVLDRDPDEWIEHVADRPNHDRRYLINPAKLENELGWSPSLHFDTALDDTVRWYVDNEEWWTDIFHRKGELQISWAEPR